MVSPVQWQLLRGSRGATRCILTITRWQSSPGFFAPASEAHQEQAHAEQNDGRSRQEPKGFSDPHASHGNRTPQQRGQHYVAAHAPGNVLSDGAGITVSAPIKSVPTDLISKAAISAKISRSAKSYLRPKPCLGDQAGNEPVVKMRRPVMGAQFPLRRARNLGLVLITPGVFQFFRATAHCHPPGRPSRLCGRLPELNLIPIQIIDPGKATVVFIHSFWIDLYSLLF